MQIVLGISGASGTVLAKRAIEVLSIKHKLFVVATENGEKVFENENKISLYDFLRKCKNVVKFSDSNLFAPIASGSFQIDSMIILPCSCATVGKIANSCGGGLLCRTAEVFLKERRPLTICVRETPMSTPTLKNLAKLSSYGATVSPLCPQFYCGTETVTQLLDNMLGRILLSANIENNLYQKWGNLYEKN